MATAEKNPYSKRKIQAVSRFQILSPSTQTLCGLESAQVLMEARDAAVSAQ